MLAAFRAQADAAGVELALTAAADLPDPAVDPLRIRQLLGNLLANALRATPAGGRVTVELERDPIGVALTVRDTGGGMAAEMAERAFDRFSRAPDSPGSGLGLPIVRALAEAHGGAVALRSTPAAGTSVRVVLPA